MVVMVLVSMVMSNVRYLDGVLYASSDMGGVTIATFTRSITGVVFPFRLESNKMVLMDENKNQLVINVSDGEKISTGDWMYDMDNDVAVINFLKRANKVLILVASSRAADGVWMQVIHPAGYTSKYNAYIRR
jgi:hypothetical protein